MQLHFHGHGQISPLVSSCSYHLLHVQVSCSMLWETIERCHILCLCFHRTSLWAHHLDLQNKSSLDLHRVVLSYSCSTTDCCFSNPGNVSTFAFWEVAMVRVPDDGPFWKYVFRLIVGQASRKNNSSSSSSLIPMLPLFPLIYMLFAHIYRSVGPMLFNWWCCMVVFFSLMLVSNVVLLASLFWNLSYLCFGGFFATF